MRGGMERSANIMPSVTITETTAVLLTELWSGMRHEHGDERTEDDLADDAIRRVHRGFFGMAAGEGGPAESTGPFRKWASDRPAEVLLRQVDAKTFRLAQPFRFDDGMNRFAVPEDDVTDLASVPRFLTWLVPRYGRHTFAALLHDHLQDDTSIASEQADRIFRDAMGATGVPLSRRWLMWSAVALRTEWKLGGLRSARVLLWAAFFGLVPLALWPSLVVAIFLGQATMALGAAVAAAIVAPLVLSWVWGRLWRLGALGGLALVFLAVPVVLVVFALCAYLGTEWVVERLFVEAPDRNPVLTRHL
jgi:hypothetical protein